MDDKQPKDVRLRYQCSRCKLPCEVDLSQTRILGTPPMSLCCKAAATVMSRRD